MHALHGNGPSMKQALARALKAKHTPQMNKSRVLTMLEAAGVDKPQKMYDHLKKFSTERMAKIAAMPAKEIADAMKGWLEEKPYGVDPPTKPPPPKKQKAIPMKPKTGWQYQANLDPADWDIPVKRGLPHDYESMKAVHLVTTEEFLELA
eukprot:564946-Pyramimonas_sp.AAC.1